MTPFKAGPSHMNLFKEIFAIGLVLVAVLPFLWWAMIWFDHATRTRGRMRPLLFLLAIVLASLLLLILWPRTRL